MGQPRHGSNDHPPPQIQGTPPTRAYGQCSGSGRGVPAAAAPTYLDAVEDRTTNIPATDLGPEEMAAHWPGSTRYQRDAHEKRDRERCRVIAALRADGRESNRPTADRLDDCCRYPYVHWSGAAQRLKIHAHRCMSRLCPTCGRIRACRLRNRIVAAVQKIDSPRLLTLTLRSSDAPLDAQIRRLIKCFANLRRAKVWKRTTSGGIYVIEVTFNAKRQQWHPHVHALIDGVFIPREELKDAWLHTTGDSDIIDIRQVRSRRQAAEYITQYTTKSQDASHVPDERIPEWAEATSGLRMASTFGSLHGSKLSTRNERDPKEDHEDDDILCSLAALARDAEDGDKTAAKLYDHVRILTQPKRADATALDTELATAIHRQVAGRLRAWWSDRQNISNRKGAANGPDRTPGNRPRDGTLRLWQDPDDPRTHPDAPTRPPNPRRRRPA